MRVYSTVLAHLKDTPDGIFFWFTGDSRGLPATLINDKIYVYITTPDMMTFTIDVANNFRANISIHDEENGFYIDMTIPRFGTTKGKHFIKFLGIHYDSLFGHIVDQDEGFAVQVLDGNIRFSNSRLPCQYFMKAGLFFQYNVLGS